MSSSSNHEPADDSVARDRWQALLIVEFALLCFFKVWAWAVMILQQLFLPSPQERAYRRNVGARPVLTDEEFYARFYAESDIPQDIPARVRSCLEYMDMFIERAYPEDMIAHAYDDLDYYDVLFRIERAFGVQFSKEDYPLFTGTLGNLIEQVHERLRESR